MNILRNTRDYILNTVPSAPPETGGILGSVDNTICECVFDKSRSVHKGCFYTPNVTFLNGIIEKWQQKGITFQGIFHTHFWGVDTLSDGDIAYITTIMQAMPSSIGKLYFPIVVLPEKKIVSYLAMQNGDAIKIKSDTLNVV